MNLLPYYKKFESKIPGFSEVGQQMYNAWFADCGLSKRLDFTYNEISLLLQYMWHEIQGLKAIITDCNNKITFLKGENEKLLKENRHLKKMMGIIND